MNEVERYRLRTRWFHWIHAAAFLILAITGLFLFAPWFSEVAIGGVSRLVHRVFAVIFVLAPLVYLAVNPKTSVAFVKDAFRWGREDIGWLLAAPDYYFGGDPNKMPPQEHINTGQKLYWLTALLSGTAFVITGVIMWGLKGAVPASVFQLSVVVHDVAFILAGVMFLVHFQLSVLHPRMSESLRSMWTGRVSTHYASSHYGKWYNRISKMRTAPDAGANQADPDGAVHA